MARPMWTGFLRLSLVSCPITLTPATSQATRIHLHEINPKTGNRVHQHLVDEETGREVQRADLDWQPKTFHDEYQDALRALVKAKQKGKEPKLPEIETPASNVVDLMSVLRQSLEDRKHAGRKRSHAARRSSPKRKSVRHRKRA
jgi:non-homologous end joining protein Ku